MSGSPADYLNEQFFQRALEEGLRDVRISINKHELKSIGTGGENYCSNIYRAKVEFQRDGNDNQEKISLIVKSILDLDNGFLRHLQVYTKEKVFYMDILPRMEVLQKDIKTFGPKYFYSITDPVQTIVLEDLSCDGFELQNRQKGLDKRHSLMIFRELGRFHGLSMVLLQKDPSTIKKRYHTGLLHEEGIRSPTFSALFGSQLLKLATITSEWKGFEEISKKLFNYHMNFVENTLRAVYPLEGEVNVLNHGDVWINNLMFKHNEHGQPFDMKMIDFQFSFYGSPGFDLNYFLNTSVQLNVLMENREKFIKAYHESLKKTLIELGHAAVPSLKDIMKEVRQKESYGLFVSFTFFPMMSMHKADSNDNSLEGLQDKAIAERKIEIMFTTNERTLQTLKYLLKRFNEIGILD